MVYKNAETITDVCAMEIWLADPDWLKLVLRLGEL